METVRLVAFRQLLCVYEADVRTPVALGIKKGTMLGIAPSPSLSCQSGTDRPTDMSQSIDSAAVLKAVEDFQDPETGRSVVAMEQVQDIRVEDSNLHVTLSLSTFCAPLWEETRENFKQKLNAAFPSVTVHVHDSVHEGPIEQKGEFGLKVKHIIIVGSGKGGVGKSTIATALAFGLQRAGCKVGFMDADVYGPSIPHLLGVTGRPEIDQETRKIIPKMKNGMPVMSMGLLVEPDQPVVLRGPMLHGAITQFLRDTDWGELDYLVIDMPPGTGDIPLTLSQVLQGTGAVVVCTPQDVALLDAVKAIAMFRKVNIPILGLVENMSGFVCPDCEKMHEIFGSGGAQTRAETLQVPFLGKVPINIQIREKGDSHEADSMFENVQAKPFLEKLCYQLVRNLVTSRKEEPPLPTLNVL